MSRKGRSRMSKSSRVSEKVLEYYMQFGKERELEKFMRFRSPSSRKSGTSTTTTSSSGDEWAQVGNLKTLFCEQGHSTSPTEHHRHATKKPNAPIINSPKKEHIVPIRIESSCNDGKPLSNLTSPKTTPKDKQPFEQKTTQTPESVKKSHKRLEWDSLADVGYRKSKSTSNISIVERMLLREFFEVTTNVPKQTNSSENDIRLLEQEIAELGTLKKHFSKPPSPPPAEPQPPPPPAAIQKDAATEYSSPLASSTHVELIVPKTNVTTTGTNTTPLEPRFEKYAQTSIQRPEMTSQEIQVTITPTASSLCSSVEPSSFEYQHQPSTASDYSKLTAPSQICDDQTNETGTHPFVQNVNKIIARRKALAERSDTNIPTTDGEKENDQLKKLYENWQNILDGNKENTSSSDCSTATSSTPQIDLGIQLICAIMKAKSIDQKQKKRLLRNIVKRLANVASSCELDAIVSRTASLINIKLGESEPARPEMDAKIRNRAKSAAPTSILKQNKVPVGLEGGQHKTSAKKKELPSGEKSLGTATKLDTADAKKTHSQTKKQNKSEKIAIESVVVKRPVEIKVKKSPQKTKEASIERKSPKKEVRRHPSPTKTSSLPKTSTTKSKSRTTAGQSRKSSKGVHKENSVAAAESSVSTTTTDSTTTTTTCTSSAENGDKPKKAVFEFVMCIPPNIPSPAREEVSATTKTSSSRDLPTEKEVLPVKAKDCEEWLRPMTQSEIEYECKKRLAATNKDEKRRSRSSSARSSERKVQLNWIECEIDRLQNLRCLLLEGNNSASSSADNESEEQTAPQTRKSKKIYEFVVRDNLGAVSSKEEDKQKEPEQKNDKKPKVIQRRCSVQRCKIDTPVESCSVKSFVRQRKHEFLEHYKSQKLHHYNNMQHKSDEGPFSDCAGFSYAPQTCSQYPQYGQYAQCSIPNTMPYGACGNYYTYPPMHQMPTNSCCYYPTMQSGGQAPTTARVNFPNKTTRFCNVSTPNPQPHTSSSALAVSSEVSVPMGSYGMSSTPTTTHQYDDVGNAALGSATTIAPSLLPNADVSVQTGASLERRSIPVVFPSRCASPGISYNMVPYSTYAACSEVAQIAQTAAVQIQPKGVAYALEFVPKSRSKPDGHSEINTSLEEFKLLDKRGGTSLQAALQHGRPEFMEEAKKRKAILNRLQQLRQERERDMRDIADDNSSINTLDRRLEKLPPAPTEHVRIFATKEMKAITNKRAAVLPEVLAGKEREREERRRRSNRMLREVFNRRLQQRVRKGKLSLNHSRTVI